MSVNTKQQEIRQNADKNKTTEKGITKVLMGQTSWVNLVGRLRGSKCMCLKSVR